MKKNSKSQNDKRDEMTTLNDELGLFGLEPPKIYGDRRSQSTQRQTTGTEKHNTNPHKPAKSNKKSLPTREQNIKNIKKKRKLKKKFKIAFTAIGLVLIVAIIVVVLSLTVLFKIETITINGSKKYTPQQITSVLPIEKEKNLFLIDKKGAIKKLQENLPYIYDVEITRKLPSTVNITITEPQYVYYVKNSNNTYTYFDDNFKILELDAKKPAKKGIEVKKLAFKDAVVGKEATVTNKDLVSDVSALMQTISELQIKKVTAVYSESLVSNYIIYDNRITIKLGETKDIKDKIFTALSAIDRLNETVPDAEGTLTATNSKQIYFTEKK